MSSRSLLVAASLAVMLTISGCTDDEAPPAAQSSEGGDRSASVADARTETGVATARPSPARWYAAEHVERGAVLYAEHCASCHGDRGEGTFDWRNRGEDGKFPPPPLNGTAHTWHHPVRALATQIKFGAPGGQGTMPGFSGTLSDNQILEIIAWIQAQWPDDIYAQWFDIEMRSRASGQ